MVVCRLISQSLRAFFSQMCLFFYFLMIFIIIITLCCCSIFIWNFISNLFFFKPLSLFPLCILWLKFQDSTYMISVLFSVEPSYQTRLICSNLRSLDWCLCIRMLWFFGLDWFSVYQFIWLRGSLNFFFCFLFKNSVNIFDSIKLTKLQFRLIEKVASFFRSIFLSFSLLHRLIDNWLGNFMFR